MLYLVPLEKQTLIKELWPSKSPALESVELSLTNFNQNELNTIRHICVKLNDNILPYKQMYWKIAVTFPGTPSLSLHYSMQ